MIRKFLFWLCLSLVFVTTYALAQTPVMFGGQATTSHPSVAYPTAFEACQSYNGGTNVDHVQWADDGHFKCYRVSTPTPTYYADVYSISGWCDSPGTMDHTTGACMCPDGTQQSTDMCANHSQPNTCHAGTYAEHTYADGGPGATVDLPTTDGTCDVTVTKLVRCYSVGAGASKAYYCTYGTTQTGNMTPAGSGTGPASGAPAADDSSQPEPSSPKSAGQGKSCPAGTVNIGTDSDGGAMCAGSGTSPSTPSTTQTTLPPTTVTNGDGSTTKTEKTQTANPDGSTTTRTVTTTTGTDGTVTTKTSTSTSSDVSGNAGISKPDPSKDDLCTQHPELNVCKNSTVDGACDTTACTGDAIQCAILRQQRKQYCEDHTETPASTLGGQMMSGNDPMAGSLPSPSNGSAVDFSGTQINTSGFLGGGSGLTDKVITVRGQTITIPLAQMNQYLLGLRAAIMILALLSSFRMVSGVIFRE